MTGRDWELFSDWCTATGRDPGRATVDTVAAFSAAMSAGPSTARQRARAILRRLGKAPEPHRDTAWRSGPQWLSHAEALYNLTSRGWPGGFAEQRDAVLVTLIGPGRFTRDAARTIEPRHIRIEYGLITVRGWDLPYHYDPHRCALCHAWLWLTAVSRVREHDRDGASMAIADMTWADHVCRSLSDIAGHAWTQAPHLISGIDRHGWMTPAPLSARSVTAILGERLRADMPSPPSTTTQAIAPPPPPRAPSRRVDPDPDGSVAARLDRIEADIDAVLARSEALLRGLDPA